MVAMVYLAHGPDSSHSAMSPFMTSLHPADVHIWNSRMKLRRKVSKLKASSRPATCGACMKKFMPMMA